MSSIEETEATLSRKRRERPRFPLVFKIFLLTALLIALVIALAIGVTIQRSSDIATETVNDAIARAALLFKDLEQKRLKELSLGVFSLSRHVPFYAYIERGLQTDPRDLTSILDSLQEQQTILGSDVLMATDDQGILLARSDRPLNLNAPQEDLYTSQPLVRESIDGGSPEAITGVVELEGRLYHAAVAPLRVGADSPTLGYLVNAYAIDENFANQIARSTNTGVVFVPVSEGLAVRSTNAPNSEALRNMSELDRLFQSGKMLPPSTAEIDRSKYVMTAEPLASQGPPAGAAIFARSLDRELAPFRQIEQTLLMAGAAALILAFILSWFIAARLTKPITRLASMAQSVTEGDYSVQPVFKRSDEIGILAGAFAKMISALRDKAELEQLYEEMSARMKGAPAAQKILPATQSEGTIMVTDLRGTPTSVEDGQAEKVVALIRNAMKLQQDEIRRQEGKVLELVGHRLVSVFEGDRGMAHAIRAARAIDEELGLRMSDQYPMTVGVGIATGDYVSGSVDIGDGDVGIALIGNAPLLALLFAWEAPSSHAFVSLESAQAAGSEVLARSKKEEVRLRWLPNPMPAISIPLASLRPGMLRTSSGTLGGAATLKLPETPPQVQPAEMAPGTVFAGRYVIEQVLGRGGMGIVYRAKDRELDEIVAIKTLPGDVLARAPEEVERFKREIRLARKITHRNVLRTYDYGEANGMYFISMEFVRGYSLAEMLEKNPRLAPRAALGIARQVCRGLQAAHEEGIIHRDIKPQNVLIDSRGEVKLMDFGIARMSENKEALTSAGLIIGTPHYMSPEQIQARPLDPRTDVYSMGVLIYEMLCGQRPFDDPTLTAVLTAHITQPPRPPIELRPEIGPEVNRIILRCLAKDPAHRYANAGELLQDLDRLQVVAAAA